MLKLTMLFLILISGSINAIPQGEIFTYQGELIENGQPVNGIVNLAFDIYTAQTNGNLVAFASVSNVFVVDGIFTVELDLSSFNSTFDFGDEFWIELSIQSGATTETLSPRQLISNVPYALNSKLA